MPRYAAHAPPGPPDLAAVDRVALVPQGFSWPAFLFGPWWLLFKRLWRALLGWLVVTIALTLVGHALGAPAGAVYAGQMLIALWLGLEGASLRSAALGRSGRPLADIVAAPDEDTALQAFFQRWLSQDEPAPPSPQSPAPPAGPSRPPGDASLRQPVIGLFPQPWGRAR